MHKKTTPLSHEVTELLLRSIHEEATAKVWGCFEEAWSELDESSQALLREHFEGATVTELSQRRNLSQKETEAWLQLSKRKLMHRLRQETQTRQ